MASIVRALGPERVCCLTGIRRARAETSGDSATETGVYRRPAAFARPKLIQMVGWGAAVAEIMLRERPKAVQLATLYEGYLGLWLRRWLNLPYVIYAHGNEVLDAVRSDWPGHRIALQEADHILAVSQFTQDLVLKSGVNPDRVSLVHPGCDVERFRPQGVSPAQRVAFLERHHEAKVILTVGRLVPRKGHDVMIRALPLIRKRLPNVCYVIVGRGPQRARLEILAKELHVADLVMFKEGVSNDQLPLVYAMCDVFAMVSRQNIEGCDVEGFGLVFLEANACGKPVLAGRSGGMGDAVVDGVTGMLVDPDRPDSVAEAAVTLLADGELASKLGRQGRERAVSEFSWFRAAERVSTVLDEVVRLRRPSNRGMNLQPKSHES